jgi:hypothetical protein
MSTNKTYRNVAFTDEPKIEKDKDVKSESLRKSDAPWQLTIFDVAEFLVCCRGQSVVPQKKFQLNRIRY